MVSHGLPAACRFVFIQILIPDERGVYEVRETTPVQKCTDDRLSVAIGHEAMIMDVHIRDKPGSELLVDASGDARSVILELWDYDSVRDMT